MFQPTPFDKYYLLNRLAVGGMAELFLAFESDPPGPRMVVIKRVHPQFVEQTEFIEMFIDEARIASTLRHPNIVGLLDFGQVEASNYIAFAYVEGSDLGNLRDLMVRTKASFNPLDAVWIAEQICHGLTHAHTSQGWRGKPLGIVHRDVTPGNVLCSLDGAVKITDFGIAKAAGKLHQTRAGQVKGKMGYMSPEMLAGKAVDARHDIFSTGIVLWELLTNRALIPSGNTAEMMDVVLNGKVPPPSSVNKAVPSALDAVVLKALRPNVEDRHQSAEEFAEELRAWRATQGSKGERTRNVSELVRRYALKEVERRRAKIEGIAENLGLQVGFPSLEQATVVVSAGDMDRAGKSSEEDGPTQTAAAGSARPAGTVRRWAIGAGVAGLLFACAVAAAWMAFA